MRVALVTGGAGFIGSHLAERFAHEDWKVRIIDNFNNGSTANINGFDAEVVRGDLKVQASRLRPLWALTRVSIAANPEVRMSTTNPEVHFSENVVATFNLLEALRKNGVNARIFGSHRTCRMLN